MGEPILLKNNGISPSYSFQSLCKTADSLVFPESWIYERTPSKRLIKKLKKYVLKTDIL